MLAIKAEVWQDMLERVELIRVPGEALEADPAVVEGP